MKIKTSALIRTALNWAVAKCETKHPIYHRNYSVLEEKLGIKGYNISVETKYDSLGRNYNPPYSPSTDWAQGGPIIEREKISTTIDHSGLWIAFNGYNYSDEKEFVQCDRSQLIAAMRCYVASKLGNEVDIPEELL